MSTKSLYRAVFGLPGIVWDAVIVARDALGAQKLSVRFPAMVGGQYSTVALAFAVSNEHE